VVDPDESEVFLEAVVEAIDGNYGALGEFFEGRLERRARPEVVNHLAPSFPGVKAGEFGWKVEDFLVTWEGEIYRDAEHMNSESFRRGGGSVEKIDSEEAIQLNGASADSIDVEGLGVMFSGQEVEFLSKVVWLLKRREKYDDETLWSQYE
jgi:hypothetical protein